MFQITVTTLRLQLPDYGYNFQITVNNVLLVVESYNGPTELNSSLNRSVFLAPVDFMPAIFS